MHSKREGPGLDAFDLFFGGLLRGLRRLRLRHCRQATRKGDDQHQSIGGKVHNQTQRLLRPRESNHHANRHGSQVGPASAGMIAPLAFYGWARLCISEQ